MYLVSFGQLSYVTDYAYGLIPPSGIHLEPHGAHQALRIDGTGNSGENIRIDTTLGSTGISIYESPAPGLYCEELGRDCSESYPLYIRGGQVHLEDLSFARSATDARNAGVWMLHETSLGVEHFYTWHTDPNTALPVHCTWNTMVTANSLVRVQAYTTSPDLLHSHSYALVEVWGPGSAPAVCTASQNIKTDAAGVYTSNLPKGYETEGGFSVAILGPSATPLWPGDWQEGDRPSFLYEVLEPLSAARRSSRARCDAAGKTPASAKPKPKATVPPIIDQDITPRAAMTAASGRLHCRFARSRFCSRAATRTCSLRTRGRRPAGVFLNR
jgi:hypothetical protein